MIKDGDVISLVEELLHVNAYESAKQINEVFGLGVNFGRTTSNLELNKYKQMQEAKANFKKWENQTFQLLCDYLHSLNDIKKYQERDKIEYFIDIFIYGTDEDKLWFKRVNQKVVQKLERELRR